MICKKCKKEIPEGSLFCNHCGHKQGQNRTHRRGNGLGTAYRYRAGWRCEVTVGHTDDGRRIVRTKAGFRTKKEALEYIPTLQRAKAKATRTLQYYYDSWSKTDMEKLSPSKRTAYRIAWKKIEEIHHTNVSDLSIVMLRDIVSEVAPTFYPARDIKSLLSHLLKLAIADQQIIVNMSEYITLPKQKETEQMPWNEEELRTIWQQYDSGSAMAAYLLLMIYSGMMPGELFNCTKAAIDIEKQIISGIGLKTEVRKKTPIVIADMIIPVVESILTFTPEDYPKIVRRNKWEFYDDYHEFTAKAGIRDLPMYSCRHTTATALAVGTSVAPSVVQMVMRHSKFTTTQRYIHPDTNDALSAVNSLAKPI